MRRHPHDAVLAQDHVFRKHAVDGAAERGAQGLGRDAPGDESLHEDARYSIAGFDARDARPNLDHFADAIR